MRLFGALLRRYYMPNGNIYTGKHRIVKPVTKDDYCKLKLDFEIEERNMFYLRHSYLTLEQSRGHVKALGKPDPFQAIVNKKKDFYENVPVESRLAHLRYGEGFFDAFKFALPLAVINQHVKQLGQSFMLGGILNAAVAAMELISSPIVGTWSDSYGRRFVLLRTLVVSFIGNAITGVFSLPLFFIGRVIYGATHHTDPLIKAAVIDIFPDKQIQSQAFNKLMQFPGLAFMCAPVLGGVLYQHYGSFSVICATLCTIDALLIAIVFMYMADVKGEKKNEEKTNRDWRKYFDLLSVKLAVEVAYMFYFANSSLILAVKHNFTQTQVGLYIAYLSITMIAGSIIAPHINKRFYINDALGSKRIMHSLVLMVVCFTVLMAIDNAILLMLLLLPAGLAKMMLEIAWMEALTERTSESEKGLAMGLATSMLSGAGLICPLISGAVADYIGIHMLSSLPFLPSIIGTILANKIKKPHAN